VRCGWCDFLLNCSFHFIFLCFHRLSECGVHKLLKNADMQRLKRSQIMVERTDVVTITPLEAEAIAHPGIKPPKPKPEPPAINPAEFAHMRKMFDQFDLNRNGIIDCKELQALMTSVGQKSKMSAVKELMSMFDLDHNNGLDFNEFQRMWPMIETAQKAAVQRVVAVVCCFLTFRIRISRDSGVRFS
jgi:hypothetical protein